MATCTETSGIATLARDLQINSTVLSQPILARWTASQIQTVEGRFG